MLELRVDENLYGNISDTRSDRFLGTSSHSFIPADKDLWKGNGNYKGIGVVLFRENENLRAITGIATEWSLDMDHSQKIFEAISPKINIGNEQYHAIHSQLKKDNISYSIGMQYSHTDVDCTGLLMEGNHIFMIDGDLGKVNSFDEFTNQWRKYQSFVSQLYDNGRGEGDPNKLSPPLAALPNNRMNMGRAHLLINYRERSFKLGAQSAPGSPDSMLEMLSAPGRSILREVMQGDHDESDLSLDSMLWTDRVERPWSELYQDPSVTKQTQMAIAALETPSAFTDLGLLPYVHSKLFFSGPRGMGKSLYAEAMAAELQSKFGDDILIYKTTYGNLANHWRGKEARGIKSLFRDLKDKLESGKKVFWFMDEIQHIAQRQGPDMKHGNEVLDELLDPLGRCHEWGPILFIGATAAHLATLDNQMTRFGRLGTMVDFTLPNEDRRKGFIEWNVARLESKKTIEVPLFQDLDYNIIAKETNQFSLADLDGALQTPLREAARSKILEGKEYQPITTEEVLKATSQTMTTILESRGEVCRPDKQ